LAWFCPEMVFEQANSVIDIRYISKIAFFREIA